jgi:hypothetical protein
VADLQGNTMREPALQRLLTVTLNSHHFSERIAAVHTFKVWRGLECDATNAAVLTGA